MPREPSKANHKPNLLFQGFAWRCIGLPFICLFWTLALTSLVTSEHRISYDRPPWGVLQTRSVITHLELCPGREKPHYFPYYSAVKVICCVTFCRSAKQRDIVYPKRNIPSLATHPHMESWVKFPGLRNIYDVSQQNSAVAFPRTMEVENSLENVK